MPISNPIIIKALVIGVVLLVVTALAIHAWRHAGAFGRSGLILLLIVATLYGGTKPDKPRFIFDGGIKDNGSWVSNDVVHVAWQKLPGPLPDNAPVYIDYRPYTATNEEWGLLGQSVVDAFMWEDTLADATNFCFNIYAYYIPPEPVHTNGVWTYTTIKDRAGENIVPLRTRIIGDGKPIYPPKQKWEEYHWTEKRRITDYLYEIEFDKSYPDMAELLYESMDISAGHCSARRSGDIFERNYDWLLSHAASFVTRVTHGEGRYASIGVASAGDRITDEMANRGDYTDAYFALPGMTLDGVNEAGVFASINVVATNGAAWEVRGERDINALGAVRHVLDNFGTAQAAAAELAECVFIPDALKRRGYSAHFIVGDEAETWIVEDGVAHMAGSLANTTVMTNYRLYAADPYGTGYERFDILAGGGNITSAWFRAAYRRPFSRPTEFAAPGVGTHTDTAALLSWAEANIPQGAPETLVRGGGSWQTVHTSVYNIRNRTLSVMVQERPTAYNFTLETEDRQ